VRVRRISYSFVDTSTERKDAMSLPEFDSQIELFGLQVRRDDLFEADDRYRIFAEKVYPVLVRARERLAGLYCADNGRPAIEPVMVLGVSLLQFMERLPDRQALEHLKYHVGWKYALGQELGERVFDPTSCQIARCKFGSMGDSDLSGESLLFFGFGTPDAASVPTFLLGL